MGRGAREGRPGYFQSSGALRTAGLGGRGAAPGTRRPPRPRTPGPAARPGRAAPHNNGEPGPGRPPPPGRPARPRGPGLAGGPTTTARSRTAGGRRAAGGRPGPGLAAVSQPPPRQSPAGPRRRAASILAPDRRPGPGPARPAPPRRPGPPGLVPRARLGRAMAVGRRSGAEAAGWRRIARLRRGCSLARSLPPGLARRSLARWSLGACVSPLASLSRSAPRPPPAAAPASSGLLLPPPPAAAPRPAQRPLRRHPA